MSDVALQKDQLWSVDGLGFPATYYFTGASGRQTQQTVEGFFDGGSVVEETIVTEATRADVTLMAMYRSVDHRAICAALDTRLARREKVMATLKQLDVDADKSPIGTAQSLRGQLTSIKWPDHDTTSTTKAQVELVFKIPVGQ